jgi:diphthamide synthase (EF-2-diphthine--ammonia ligase)
MPRELAGRRFDADLLGALPANVDPCGENGEFHTCVCDGPMFAGPVRLRVGELEKRDPFAWADLLLANGDAPHHASQIADHKL